MMKMILARFRFQFFLHTHTHTEKNTHRNILNAIDIFVIIRFANTE